MFVKNALLEAVALDKTFHLTQSDVPDKYVSASYDRDFGSILRNVAGAGSLFEPPPLAMHEGKTLDACIDTFRFNLLEPLRIAGCREAVASDDGKSYDEVQFATNNGELTLRNRSADTFFRGGFVSGKAGGRTRRIPCSSKWHILTARISRTANYFRRRFAQCR